MNKLLATLLILGAAPVWAEWVLYDNSIDGNVRFFYDPSTVKGGNIKRAWDKAELKTPMESGALSFRSYNEIDCVKEKIRVLQLEAFSKAELAGKTVGSFSEPTGWDYVAPNTIEKRLFNIVCGTK